MKNESPRAGALIFYASGYGQAPFVDDVRAASRVTILPLLKPTIATVTIIDTMAFWNDYLLPSLVLNVNKYKTVQIAVQNLKQSYGQIDWGAMMAVLVLAIIPIVIFYIFAQKYIIEGVMSGAVKG